MAKIFPQVFTIMKESSFIFKGYKKLIKGYYDENLNSKVNLIAYIFIISSWGVVRVEIFRFLSSFNTSFYFFQKDMVNCQKIFHSEFSLIIFIYKASKVNILK